MKEPYVYGAQHKKWLWAALSSLLLLFLLSLALLPDRRSPQSRFLTIYCAASLRLPIESAAAEFERMHGVTIRLDYGSSGALETRLRQDVASGLQLCDIFIPADETYVQHCLSDQIIFSPVKIAQSRLVYACPQPVDYELANMADILAQHQYIVVCDNSAAAGAKTKQVLADHGYWQSLQEKHLRSAATVVEAAGWIRNSGIVQGGFIWSTTAKQHELGVYDIAELSESVTTIAAGISSKSLDQGLAAQFIEFLQLKEGGMRYFLDHHFDPVRAFTKTTAHNYMLLLLDMEV